MFDVSQSTSQSTRLILKRTVLGEGQQEKEKNMGDCSSDIFDTEEGGRNEEYKEEGEKEEDPDEEQEEEGQKCSSPEDEGELRTMNQTMICGVLYVRKWGKISKSPT